MRFSRAGKQCITIKNPAFAGFLLTTSYFIYLVTEITALLSVVGALTVTRFAASRAML